MGFSIKLSPGRKLTASAVFLTKQALFVSIRGPAAVTFASIWTPAEKEIVNDSDDLWQLFVYASHHGPIGSEVPTWLVCLCGSTTLIGAGSRPRDPEALLAFTVTG